MKSRSVVTIVLMSLRPASPCVAANAGATGSIFADGFESGDTSAWSGTVGGS